jgi:hypothetical protein
MNHVKGHRDSQILYTSLRPLPAQLNVDADSLATKELQEQPRLIHHIPLFPHSKVQLVLLSGTSLTRKLSGAIHKRQGYRNLIPYMFDWYGWTANITDSVDWDWFAAAHKLCLQQRKFVFKFCMSLLPTEKNSTLAREPLWQPLPRAHLSPRVQCSPIPVPQHKPPTLAKLHNFRTSKNVRNQ